MKLNIRRASVLFSLVLASLASSAWATGPGIGAFEEGKGTIGMACTTANGRTFNSPTFATPTTHRDTVQREYNLCLRDVLGQWEVSAAEIPSLGEREHAITRNVTTYVDGWNQYMTEFMSMRNRAIGRLRRDAR